MDDDYSSGETGIDVVSVRLVTLLIVAAMTTAVEVASAVMTMTMMIIMITGLFELNSFFFYPI